MPSAHDEAAADAEADDRGPPEALEAVTPEHEPGEEDESPMAAATETDDGIARRRSASGSGSARGLRLGQGWKTDWLVQEPMTALRAIQVGASSHSAPLRRRVRYAAEVEPAPGLGVPLHGLVRELGDAPAIDGERRGVHASVEQEGDRSDGAKQRGTGDHADAQPGQRRGFEAGHDAAAQALVTGADGGDVARGWRGCWRPQRRPPGTAWRRARRGSQCRAGDPG